MTPPNDQLTRAERIRLEALAQAIHSQGLPLIIRPQSDDPPTPITVDEIEQALMSRAKVFETFIRSAREDA